jgi:hypothetical protein
MAPPLTSKSLILHPPTEGCGPIKRSLHSLLLAFGSALDGVPAVRRKGDGYLLLPFCHRSNSARVSGLGG